MSGRLRDVLRRMEADAMETLREVVQALNEAGASSAYREGLIYRLGYQNAVLDTVGTVRWTLDAGEEAEHL